MSDQSDENTPTGSDPAAGPFDETAPLPGLPVTSPEATQQFPAAPPTTPMVAPVAGPYPVAQPVRAQQYPPMPPPPGAPMPPPQGAPFPRTPQPWGAQVPPMAQMPPMAQTPPMSQVPPAPPGRVTRPGSRRAGAVVPRWLLPTTGLLALLLGVVGGFVGAQLNGDPTGSPTVGGSTEPRPTGASQPAPLPAGNGSVTKVAQQMLPSTVQVLAFAEADATRPTGTGSGFVLDGEGHVVSNNHVVADTLDGGAVRVVASDGDVLDVEVVGRSAVYDVAVLKVTDDVDLPPAVLGAEGDLRVGEPVVAIGAPLGLNQTVTSGIVSALNRPVTTGAAADETSYISAVQTDAAINPGNSGGPLMNMRGQVIGVNTAIATTGGSSGEVGSIGVGFAIPIEQVRRTVDQILTDGKAQFPIIGATVQPIDVSFEGARITEIEDGGPADEAGLRTGDRVVRVADQRVSDGVAMIVAIRTHRPGETITLTVERLGREMDLEVTLDARTG